MCTPLPSRTHEVLKCAIISRLFVFLLSFLLTVLHVTDYDTSSNIASLDPNAKPADTLIQTLFGRFVKWDAIYFVRIAERGYEYEQFYAFYPFYPMLVRFVAKGVQLLIGVWLSERSLIILSGFFVSNFSFVLSSLELYKLGCAVVRDETTSFISSILYTINPASIFMSALYTESTYALFAFSALNFLTNRKLIRSSLFFFLCTATRSNGILLTGFIVFRLFYTFWHQCFAYVVYTIGRLRSYITASSLKLRTPEQFRKQIRTECSINDTGLHTGTRFLFAVVMCVVALAPMSLFQIYGTANFCPPGYPEEQRAYCKYWFMPKLYSHVQTFYWNQGFFHYYESKQIPNFLLALPMIALSILGICTYFYNRFKHLQRLKYKPKPDGGITKTTNTNNNSNNTHNPHTNGNNNHTNNNQKRSPDTAVINKDQSGYLGPELLPYVLYWLGILLLTLTFMHVQVITRFFSSCPPVYWFCGHVFFNKNTSWYTTIKKVILGYFLFYVLVGTALFGLYYPWT